MGKITVDDVKDGKILSNRSCTDCLMIVVFFAFIIGWIVVASVAITNGKPSRILLPSNFRGQLCGDGNLTDWPVLFVPLPSRLTYGLCEKTCPSQLDYVCNNDVEPLQWNTSHSEPNTYFNMDALEFEAGPTYASRCLTGCSDASDQLKANRYVGLLQKIQEFKCFLAFYNSAETLYRCLPFGSSTANLTLAEQLGQSLDTLNSLSNTFGASTFFMRGFGDVKQTWVVILISFGTAVGFSMIWIMLLRWILAPIVYLSIVLILAALCALGYFSYTMANDLQDVQLPGETSTSNQVKLWRTLQYVAWIGAGMYLVLVMWLIKRIRIAIEVMKEASKAFLSAPGMVFIPPVCMVFLLGISAFFIVVMVYIQTIGDLKDGVFKDQAASLFGDSLVNSTADLISGASGELANFNLTSANATVNTTDWSTATKIKALHAYNFFGFLWSANLIIMYGFFVMAMTTVSWYFSASAEQIDAYHSADAARRETGCEKSAPRFAVTRSALIGLRYHFGTILWGALLIAIVQFVRALLIYLEEQILSDYKDQTQVKIIIYCINCIMECIERVIKVISKNAFIITCIKNTNFCSSAIEAMRILINNVLRVGATSTMSTVACFILKLLITASNWILAYWLMKVHSLTDNRAVESGLFPLVGIFILSFLVASLFINVYESCVDTVLMCFFVDDEDLDGAFMPPALAQLVDKFKQVEEARRAYEQAVKKQAEGTSKM